MYVWAFGSKSGHLGHIEEETAIRYAEAMPHLIFFYAELVAM